MSKTTTFILNHNFFKEHETLGNTPPAVRMGATPIKDWAEVISQAKVAMPVKPKVLMVVRAKPIKKRKHPKRKPKGLRQRAYIVATATTLTK